MYFSGGVELTAVEKVLTIKPFSSSAIANQASSPLKQDNLAFATTASSAAVKDGEFPETKLETVLNVGLSSAPAFTSQDNKSASSAMGPNMSRRQFLKQVLRGGAIVTLMPDEAIAAVFKILGIPLEDVVEGDPRIKIVENALKKLKPWEIELLKRYNISIRNDKESNAYLFSAGRVRKRKVLLVDRYSSIIDMELILHEIGHVIWQIIVLEMFKDRWLPNYITYVHKELQAEFRDEYSHYISGLGLPPIVIKASIDNMFRVPSFPRNGVN